MRKPIEFDNHPAAFQGGRYRAFCRYVVDGDTFDFLVDLGLYQYAYITIRLEHPDGTNIDAPEIRGEERPLGLEYKEWAQELLLDRPCVIVTRKDKTTFGRFVADVEFPDENGEMISFAQLLREKLEAENE